MRSRAMFLENTDNDKSARWEIVSQWCVCVCVCVADEWWTARRSRSCRRLLFQFGWRHFGLARHKAAARSWSADVFMCQSLSTVTNSHWCCTCPAVRRGQNLSSLHFPAIRQNRTASTSPLSILTTWWHRHCVKATTFLCESGKTPSKTSDLVISTTLRHEGQTQGHILCSDEARKMFIWIWFL